MSRAKLPNDQLTGKAVQAAKWLHENGGRYDDAGARFGVSRQAVQESWMRLGFGSRRQDAAMAALVPRVLELARAGIRPQQIARDVGVSLGTVRSWCRGANVTLVRSQVGPPMRDPEALERGLEAVRRGESVATGALTAGMTYGAFQRRLRKAGIHATTTLTASRASTKSAQASELMDRENISVCQAAFRIGIAPGSLRRWRTCRGLK